MENPLISILIPCYNVEHNLPFCLNSVINQTYSNLEIICVNDGSEDNTINILKEYAEKDRRIIVINQENKGVSAARNIAISVSTGEYITFVDSDDYIDSRFCERLLSLIFEYSADIARANARGTASYDYNEPPLEHEPIISTRTTQEALEIYYDGKFYGWYADNASYIWASLYKSEIVKKHYFDENIQCGEDDCYIQLVLGEADKVVYTDERLYFYYRSDNGLSKLGQNEKILFESAKSMYSTQQNFFDEKKFYNIKQLNLAAACNSFCEFYRKSKDKIIKKESVKEFRKYYRQLTSKPVSYTVFNICPVLYKIIIKLKYPQK